MTITMPETTDSFGNLSLVVLTSAPASLDAASLVADLASSENISCHMIGDWWPSATTNKVSRQRKMCQTQITQALGQTTHETPALVYTYNPQTVGTPGGAGNEAYEALPEGATVYLLQRLGKPGTSALAAGDAYRLFPVELGPQVPGASAEDEGGEFVINQEVSFASGYDGPVDGVVAA